MQNLITLLIMIITLGAQWKIYEKMGVEGLKGIIPIYNLYVLIVEILQKSIKEFIFCLIPLIQIYFVFINYYAMLKGFGKSKGFFIATIFFPFITFPMLAFGNSEFNKELII